MQTVNAGAEEGNPAGSSGDEEESEEEDESERDEEEEPESQGEEQLLSAGAISPERPLSRSPPQSRPISPITQDVEDLTNALASHSIKDKVTSELAKNRSQQQRKYHSRKSAKRAGRPKGSKAKQDTRIKLEPGWD